MNDFISHQAEKILACYTDSSLDSCINKAEENDIEKGGVGSGRKPSKGDIVHYNKTIGGVKQSLKGTHISTDKDGKYHEVRRHNTDDIDYISHKDITYLDRGEGVEKVEKSKSDDKFAKVMGEFKAGTLKSSDGSPVTKRSQAIAIAMSESGKDIEKADMEDETED